MVLLSVPATALAASGHHSAEPLPPFSDFIISKKTYWINFLVYFGIVAFLLAKALPKGWKSRRAAYVQALDSGKQKLVASEQKLSEARALYESMPQKISSIKTSLEAEVEAECKRIAEEASEKSKQISSSAAENLEAERRLNDQKFKKELIDLAINKAHAKARQSANSEVESRLRGKVVEKVNSLVN